LGRRLKRIVGVLEVGLFHGRNGIQVGTGGIPHTSYWGMFPERPI
jgi:ribose 5-phosphate isomerase